MAPSRLNVYNILEAAVMLSRPQKQQAPSGMTSHQMHLVPVPYLLAKESQKICRSQHVDCQTRQKFT